MQPLLVEPDGSGYTEPNWSMTKMVRCLKKSWAPPSLTPQSKIKLQQSPHSITLSEVPLPDLDLQKPPPNECLVQSSSRMPPCLILSPLIIFVSLDLPPKCLLAQSPIRSPGTPLISLPTSPPSTYPSFCPSSLWPSRATFRILSPSLSPSLPLPPSPLYLSTSSSLSLFWYTLTPHDTDMYYIIPELNL